MSARTFRAGFLFAGLGAGARGFLQASARLGEASARFTSVGGIDIDAEACADFEQLTGTRAVREDVATLQPARLRELWGDRAPDSVFTSPPCKGLSALLSKQAAEKPEYQRLNALVHQGIFLLLSTWDVPPSTIVLENVPRIQTRGATLLAQVRDLLLGAGYRLHEQNHDCGEIGGLAQHRRRYLLVARLERKVPAFIYRPPKKRVRACGEVLETLPLPIGAEGAAAGSMHALPKISWLTWLRLALIPPGGDWRDLPGVVPEGEQRRAVWARYDVRAWEDAARTVAGEGSNGGFAIADPRLAELVGVQRCFSVADLRLPERLNRHWNKYRVEEWRQPAGTVIGATRPGSGSATVADPRVAELVALGRTAEGADSFNGRPGLMGVEAWTEPAHAVTSSSGTTRSNARAAVADVRLGCSPRSGAYGVLNWREAASTVTGAAGVDNGRFAVADPRSAPLEPPVIRSPWDCWHRPMTTLELALLQGLPARLNGEPLELTGRSVTRKRERIGNCVPVQAAQAIGESLLLALLAASLGTWTLGSTGIWCRNDGRPEYEWREA